MEIRPTTDEDLDVFVDTVHAAFGLFPEPPVDGGGLWWSALETDRALPGPGALRHRAPRRRAGPVGPWPPGQADAAR